MKNTDLPKITRIAEHPEVVSIQEKADRLRREIAEDTRRIEDLCSPGSGAGATMAERTREAAAALLDGDEVATMPVSDRDTALREITRRRTLKRQALEIAEDRLRDLHATLRTEATEKALPAYRALLEQMADTVGALGALADREAAFREDLEALGVDPAGLEPMPLGSMRLKDEYSQASRWLAGAAEHHGVQAPEAEKLRKAEHERAERIRRQEAAELEARRDEHRAEEKREAARRKKAHEKKVQERERAHLQNAIHGERA